MTHDDERTEEEVESAKEGWAKGGDMDRFVQSVRDAIAQRNWYGALATSLILPDICGWLENPKRKSEARYTAWFDVYVGPRYIGTVGAEMLRHVFLSGADCYALRCALLHQGADSIEDQRAREVLTRFVFVAPPTGSSWVHCNQPQSVLQLQVDWFCEDMCSGVSDWTAKVYNSSNEVSERARGLIFIHKPKNSAEMIDFINRMGRSEI